MFGHENNIRVCLLEFERKAHALEVLSGNFKSLSILDFVQRGEEEKWYLLFTRPKPLVNLMVF